jgi:hypothetical protein
VSKANPNVVTFSLHYAHIHLCLPAYFNCESGWRGGGLGGPLGFLEGLFGPWARKPWAAGPSGYHTSLYSETVMNLRSTLGNTPAGRSAATHAARTVGRGMAAGVRYFGGLYIAYRL